MDGDINERLIKRNNIDDDGTTLDGTGGVRDALPFVFFLEEHLIPSQTLHIRVYILQIDRCGFIFAWTECCLLKNNNFPLNSTTL